MSVNSMDKISNFIPKLPKDRLDIADKWTLEVLNDNDVVEFINSSEGMSQEVVERDFSRLSEYVQEKKKNGVYLPILEFNEGFINIRYTINTNHPQGARSLDGITKRLVHDNITSQFKGIDFSQVDENVYNSKILLAFIRLVDGYSYKDGRKGVWLNGKFGRGKSHIMGALATELYNRGAEVIYYHAGELIKRLKRSMDYRDNQTDRIIEEMKNAEVLIIDDIGTEAISSWAINDVMYEVLNTRMTNNSLTFFNSNLTQQEYLNHLKMSNKISPLDAERMNERIEFLSKEVYLGGDNWRVKA